MDNRRNEESLRMYERMFSEAVYRSVYAQAPMAIEIYDLHGALIDVNQACLDLFGIEDKKDVFGCNLFNDPNLKEEYKERLRRKQSVRYEVAFDFAKVQEHNIYPTSRQGIIWLDVQITPIDGVLEGFLVHIQDISTAKLAEQALRDSEARWQFAIEGSGDGLWDWNVQTGRVFYSRQWKAMLGYAKEGIADRVDEWESRIHPKDYDRVQAAMKEHLAGNTELYQCEHRLRCQDGSYLWVFGRGQVFEWSLAGEPLRMLGTHSDISERKASEAERERLITDLEKALEKVQQLKGLIPICAECKRIRDDQGYWNKLETYLQQHSEARFSHGLCPECAAKLYPDLDDGG